MVFRQQKTPSMTKLQVMTRFFGDMKVFGGSFGCFCANRTPIGTEVSVRLKITRGCYVASKQSFRARSCDRQLSLWSLHRQRHWLHLTLRGVF